MGKIPQRKWIPCIFYINLIRQKQKGSNWIEAFYSDTAYYMYVNKHRNDLQHKNICVD